MQSNDSNIPAFPAFPCTSRYVALGAIEEAVTRVGRAIDSREAVALVIGPPGTGKSLLCALISQQYQQTHQVVVLGETPLADGDAMLRHLLHRLGVEAGPSQSGDPHLALVDYIHDQTDREGLIIIVDEAQKLSAEVIEAIRMVTNITRDGQPRVFALLCGGVRLDETLVDSSLESFAQRAATRCYLHPMNSEETRYYIHQTISSCGADPESTISDEAIAAIHHACSGVPRLINQLISQAIDCAAEADETLISEKFVDQGWSELQQLPGPMVEEPKLVAEASPIEFGELDESSETVQWSVEPRDAVDLESTGAVDQQTLQQADGCCQGEPCHSVADSIGCRQSVASPRGDIQLESSSAVWIEEPMDDPVNEPCEPPSGAREFGQPADPHTAELFGQYESEEEISVGSGFVSQPQTPTSAPADLETLLQQEIVGAGEPVQVSDRQADVIPLHIHSDVPGGRRDDSDLLVIEDEVAVIPIDGMNEDHPQAQSISVDFQTMLTKMQGNKN